MSGRYVVGFQIPDMESGTSPNPKEASGHWVALSQGHGSPGVWSAWGGDSLDLGPLSCSVPSIYIQDFIQLVQPEV